MKSDSQNTLPGVKLYLFNDAGSYLGITQVTHAAGVAAFEVSAGKYKVRADYLGYQFWSGATAVSSNVATDLLIAHKDVGIVVNSAFQGTLTPFSSLNTYLFTSAGSYMGKTLKTDATGKAVYSVPQKAYKVRADYMGQQYWSEEFTWADKVVNIPLADAAITMVGAGMPQANLPVYVYSTAKSYLGRQFWANIVSGQSSQVEIKEGLATVYVHTTAGPVAGATVYLFSENGSYLGMNAITDTDGYADFTLPAYPFKFMVDVAGAPYWSQVINIIEGVQSAVDVNVE